MVIPISTFPILGGVGGWGRVHCPVVLVGSNLGSSATLVQSWSISHHHTSHLGPISSWEGVGGYIAQILAHPQPFCSLVPLFHITHSATSCYFTRQTLSAKQDPTSSWEGGMSTLPRCNICT